MSTPQTLDLSHLQIAGFCSGISPGTGGMLAEAASACLEDQGHDLKVSLAVGGQNPGTWWLARLPVTVDVLRSHNDLEKATENGAYGVALLLIRELTGWTAFCQAARSGRRSIRGLERQTRQTGSDYWVGVEEAGLFQDKVRLEVSGILRGTAQQIRSRVKKKASQSARSDFTGLPALAVVVEFSRPFAEVSQR